jgi:hypothetical protein
VSDDFLLIDAKGVGRLNGWKDWLAMMGTRAERFLRLAENLHSPKRHHYDDSSIHERSAIHFIATNIFLYCPNYVFHLICHFDLTRTGTNRHEPTTPCHDQSQPAKQSRNISSFYAS